MKTLYKNVCSIDLSDFLFDFLNTKLAGNWNIRITKGNCRTDQIDQYFLFSVVKRKKRERKLWMQSFSPRRDKSWIPMCFSVRLCVVCHSCSLGPGAWAWNRLIDTWRSNHAMYNVHRSLLLKYSKHFHGIWYLICI